MKRILVLALTVAILTAPATALAAPLQSDTDLSKLFDLKPIVTPLPVIEPPAPKVKPPKPKPIVYTVVEGDNLTKIGTKYNVEWQRLWAKNTKLTNPDQIDIGAKITIPLPSERLKRAVPAAVSLPPKTPGVVPLRSYDSSNTYDYGYCTWYVKNRRGASLPNGLGNANTWYSVASSMGMDVGSAPRAGAVGTTTAGDEGHVVYVESVNDDGTIYISEMNHEGFGVVSYRTVSASEFLYIY